MKLPVRILLRTRVDYAAMDRAVFAAQNDPMRPLTFIRFAVKTGAIDAFERAFDSSFFSFRRALQRMTDDNLEQVRDIDVLAGFEEFDRWFSAPEDEVLFPIDDDDLFHPDLASLADLDSSSGVVVWEHAGYGYPGGAVLPAVHRWKDYCFLFSNNWGVRKSFLKSALDKDEARACVADHARAQVLLMKRNGIPRQLHQGPFSSLVSLNVPEVQFVRGHFGLQYFHPASLCLLWDRGLRGDIGAQLAELDLTTRPPLPPDLAWAGAFVERYQVLCDELARSRAARARG